VVVVFRIDRDKLSHLEPLGQNLIEILKANNCEPSYDWGGIIMDDEKVILVYYSPPVPIERIANALGIDAHYLVKVREFEPGRGKGRYLLHEGINRKGRYEKIEVIRE
jgi:hypothetical protein